MCVIMIKDKGVQMPSRSILRMAYEVNHDGCGFVSSNDYYKTLDFDSFCKRLSRVGTEEKCIIHMRWATHGSICRANCHPFKDGTMFFAHNGVLDVAPKGDMTDSETAFRSMIVPEARLHGFDSSEVRDVIRHLIGYSKFAFMVDGDIRMFGQYANVDGVYFSNLRFMF